MEKNRPFMRRGEWLLVALALAGLLAFTLPPRKNPAQQVTALVFIDGERVMEIDLASAPDRRIDLREWGVPGTLEVADHRIRFTGVTCPDHICEKTGFIHEDGRSAVCMPNRAAVTIIAYP